MTKEDVIRIARESGLCIDGEVAFSPNHDCADVDISDLQTFAALVAAAEREECAKLLEAHADACVHGGMLLDVLLSNAAAIRARGNHD